MSETTKNLIKYNSRLVMKHDTLEHWEQAENFIPLKGELIVYDDLRRIKIGDGETKVKDLPFSTIDINEYLGYETSGKTYPVELDEDNKLFVSVPWDNNTHYTTGIDISDAATKDPYLFIYDDSTERGKIKFEGGNNVSVASRYVDGDKIISINGTKYYAKVNGGLLLDDAGYFSLDLTHTATQILNGQSGRTGLMTPQDKYDLEYAALVARSAVRAQQKEMGFYKFSTTSYGFIDKIEDVTAEDISGMNIDTSTSGASANTGTIYIMKRNILMSMTTVMIITNIIMSMDMTTAMTMEMPVDVEKTMMMMTISHYVHALTVQMTKMTTAMTMEVESFLQKASLLSTTGQFKSWFQAVSCLQRDMYLNTYHSITLL